MNPHLEKDKVQIVLFPNKKTLKQTLNKNLKTNMKYLIEQTVHYKLAMMLGFLNLKVAQK